MKNNSTSNVIRSIALIISILVSSFFLLLFLGFLISDLIKMAKGAPLDPEGFFAGGIPRFFAGVLPPFILIGLAIAGHISFWFSEKRGIVLTFIGGLSSWLFIITDTIVQNRFPASGFGPGISYVIRIFCIILPIFIPALLLLLARRLEKRRQGPDPVMNKPA